MEVLILCSQFDIRLLINWYSTSCFTYVHAQSNNAVVTLQADDASCDKLPSVALEQDENIKDLDPKVANLYVDNCALMAKLTASRAVETEQKEKIRNLEERLFQALKEQVSIIVSCQKYVRDVVTVYILWSAFSIHDLKASHM